MTRATLTSKGQTTIPKDIRDRLALKAGDRLEFWIDANGTICVLPLTRRIADLRGLLGKPKQRLPGAKLDRAIREGWGKRWRRVARSSA